MPITAFPPIEDCTDPDGIIGIGGDLHPQSLLLAYSQGIFPWPIIPENEEPVLAWFCPPERAILNFEEMHYPKSLKKFLNKYYFNGDLTQPRPSCPFEITLNQAFGKVIRSCAQAVRKNEGGEIQGTWITDELKNAYMDFHKLGFAHSVEIWRKKDESKKLIGGIYGVCVRGVFAGESMFHKETNASKLALVFLCQKLKNASALWMDVQVLTPHITALGGKLIPRDQFLELLGEEQARNLRLF